MMLWLECMVLLNRAFSFYKTKTPSTKTGFSLRGEGNDEILHLHINMDFIGKSDIKVTSTQT